MKELLSSNYNTLKNKVMVKKCIIIVLTLQKLIIINNSKLKKK